MQRKHAKKETVVEPAVVLPQRRDGQSAFGFVRQHLALIEEAVSSGVKSRALVDALSAVDVVVTPRSLSTALYRARNTRNHAPVRQPAAQTTVPATEPTPSPPAALPPRQEKRSAVRLTPTAELKQEDLY
jgi:hypothetical protein